MAKNEKLRKAKKAKDDEFYTHISDIAAEINHYRQELNGKWIYSPFSDYRQSQFVAYFTAHFHKLGLKHYTATCLDRGDGAWRYDYDGRKVTITRLSGNGSFDGAGFDKDGNRNNWWTVADKMEFEERQKLLVDCYNHLEVAPDILPGKYANGTVTLEENIADLGGLNIALDAYTEYLQEQGYFGSVLEDQQRKFFESYADIWSCKYGEEYIKDRMDGKRPDSHALPQERINGVVMNMDIWYKLYNVTRENKLYLPPEKRTRIW